jgi:hypothetical protein
MRCCEIGHDGQARISVFVPTRPTGPNKPDGYILGSYRIATALSELKPAHELQVDML